MTTQDTRGPTLLGFFALRIIAPLSIPLLALLILGVLVYQQLVASLILDRDSELGDLAALDFSKSGIAEIDALANSFERMSRETLAYRSSLRRYIGLITQLQEEERNRIARDLHDDALQSLISIARRIEIMQNSTDNAEYTGQLASLRTQVVDTVDSVRQTSRDLRPRGAPAELRDIEWFQFVS